MSGLFAQADELPSARVRKSHSRLGVLLVCASAVAFSTAGLFTGLIKLDVWTLLFWRGIFGGAFIACYILWQHRARTFGAFQAIGSPGILVAGCSTVSTVCFINALRLTSVADVAVIYATAPFAAAAIAWLWTREQENWKTLAASLVALLGVALMFGAAISAGHIVGDLLALVMTLLVATMMVIIRKSRETSMLPAACLSAFASAVVAFPLSSPGAVTGMEFLYLALFGTTQFGLGLLLLTLGSRLLSATQSALIGNLELPLAPVWVWLAFGQTPSPMTCVGGAIVFAAISGDMTLNGRRL